MNNIDSGDVGDEQGRLRAIYASYDRDPRFGRRWARDNPANRCLEEERVRATNKLLAEGGVLPLGGKRILDVGCGSGEELARLCRLGAAEELCCGVDLLPDRIERARTSHPRIRFELADARRLQLEDGSFDLVLANFVFSSILAPDVALELAAEMRRVLAPGGAILIRDHRYRNPGNPNVRGYPRQLLETLFPGMRFKTVTLSPLPPLVRRLGSAAPLALAVLGSVPILRVDNLALIRD